MDNLILEIQQKRTELATAEKMLDEAGETKARTEKAYQMTKSAEVFKLRDQGMPVGIIDMTIRGIPSVAEARYQRDIALGKHEACKENVNILKLELRLLDAQVSREWASGGI